MMMVWKTFHRRWGKGVWCGVGECGRGGRELKSGVLLKERRPSWGIVDIIGRTDRALRRGE
jgi:hypothetical protein